MNHFIHGFQGRYLPTCDFFDLSERQVGLSSQTCSVSTPVPITYQVQVYWKQLVLQNRKGLACETKPTFCKHKQKQMKS